MITPALALCAVVLVGDDAAFVENVRSELSSSVSCVEVAKTFDPKPGQTVVRVVSPRMAEVWENTALANVLQLHGAEPVDAIKIAEHVRARSLAFAPDRAAAASGDGRADKAVDAPSRDPNAVGRFSLSAGIGPVVESGAVGAGARIGVRARVAGPVGAGAIMVATLSPSTISSTEGSAEVSTFGGGPTVDLELRPRALGLRGTVGLAGLITSTRATGVTVAPLQARSVSQVRFVPALVAGVAYAVSPQVAIEIAGVAGTAVPSLEMRFAGNEVARWGAPYVIATGGAVVTF